MTNKYILVFLLSVAFLLSACRKDFDNTTITTDPVKFIQSSIHGAIYDQNNRPVMNATVRKGNLETMTDSNGYFYILPSPCDQNGVPIHISANGYFSITKTVIPNAKGGTPLYAQLTPRVLSSTIPSAQGGIVEVQGASVKFPENGFVTSSGQPYSGPVQVYATFLNPNEQDMQLRMPGNLTAVRSDGRAAVLATFGMIGVELRSPTGAELNLAAGKEAEISIPLSGQYLALAPSAIPLWHFDNASGKWREEGKATLQGNKYVGKVSHFSFWNVDIPFDAVTLSGTITDNQGNPVESAVIKLTVLSGTATGLPAGSMAQSVTNQNGQFSGFVPANSEFLLEVFSYCNTLLHSQNLPAMNSNTMLSPINIQSDASLLLIQGSLVDCNLDGLTAPAYVKIQAGNKNLFITPASDGSIQTVVIICQENSITITGFDPVNQKQSPGTQFNISGIGNTLNVGQIQACEQLDEYIQISINGFSYTFSEAYFTNSPARYSLGGFAVDSSFFQMDINDINIGNPAITYLSAFIWDNGNSLFYHAGCGDITVCNDMQFQITGNGGPGGYLTGSFEGTLPNGSQNPAQLSGTFRVKN